MGFNLRLVQFETKDHLSLPGLLYEPAVKTKKIALYLHGNGSASVFYNTILMNEIARRLTDRNTAFFPFNNRGAHYIKKFTRRLKNKKEEVKWGTAFELIKDCLIDIDGAINFLKKQGFQTFYLIGSSTGANKICVYHYYKKNNPVSKYILLSGGDDTGLSYAMMGKQKFYFLIKQCRKEIIKGNGRLLMPGSLTDYLYSYQSMYDTINPDGDYNTFPFNESMNRLRLSKKPLFREYRSIDKPTLVVYGENDEYCYSDVGQCVEILKKYTPSKEKFTFKIIKDTDHGFNGKEKELAETVASWLVSG